MKLKSGKTYWAANRRPILCDGVVADSPFRNHVGQYRMIDLTTGARFLANSRGWPSDVDQGFRVTTKLRYKMALEIVEGLHV